MKKGDKEMKVWCLIAVLIVLSGNLTKRGGDAS